MQITFFMILKSDKYYKNSHIATNNLQISTPTKYK